MLSALPQHRLETYADPADSLQVFEGPSRADLVPLVDAHGETHRAAPLNDRGVTVPIADTDDYPSLLAVRQNRDPIVGTTKGPVWNNYQIDRTSVIYEKRVSNTISLRWCACT